jgi:peptide/nickel transport system permease protein
MALLFLLFLTLVFFLLQAQPGDISNLFIDPNLPTEVQNQLRERLGLEGSVWSQWWSYVTNFLQGNLGVSFSQYPRPVIDIILEALPRTLYLFTLATLISYGIGFTLGKHLAWRRGSLPEYSVTIGGVLLYTVFYPWFAVIMILIFGSRLGWFPLNGFLTPELWRNAPYTGNEVFAQMIISLAIAGAIAGLTAWWRRRRRSGSHPSRALGYSLSVLSIVIYWAMRPDMTRYAADIAHHSVLPITTLTLVAFAGVMLLTRSSMLDTLKEDYILTARAKGVPEHQIRDRHAARNALLPVVTSFVLGLAFIIGGGVVTETLFSWPGMGSLLLGATVVEDVPLATGAFAFIGILALVAHLIADMLYAVLDPRIRVTSGVSNA